MPTAPPAGDPSRPRDSGSSMRGLLLDPEASAQQQETKAESARKELVRRRKGAACEQLLLPRQPLIPGLPDDLGLQCLLRSSRFSIPLHRLVCRDWRDVLYDPDLFSWRDGLGLGEEWLYMCVASRRCEGRFDWYCFVPSRHAWLVLPPMPEDNAHGSVRTTGFGVTAVDGLGLFIAGGSAEGQGLLHVTVFDFRYGQWSSIHHAEFSPRVDPVVTSLGREVYIAGGKDGAHSAVHDTMLAIDAATHCVTSTVCAHAPSALVWCETLKFGQQLYARSRRDCLFGAAAGGGMVFAFDIESKSWFPTGANSVSRAWKALMAPLGGTLYMMDGSLGLWRWEEQGATWTRVGGTLMFGYVLKKLVACHDCLYAFVHSADTGRHSMLEVRLSPLDGAPLPMTQIPLPGSGYFSAIACSRL